MKNYILTLSTILFLSFITKITSAAVILQYHHVSDNTPASTSISPAQFAQHLHYLKTQHFNVVPLNQIVEAIQHKQPLADKTVAITFDDAYLDIYTQAKPLLNQFNFPFTIFINPSLVKENSSHYLSWQQIQKMAKEGVIIANHGFNHHSLARIPKDKTASQWLNEYGNSLQQAEQLIKEKTGKSWRYFAYPYGEYSQSDLIWLRKQGFIGFGQQSGAVGMFSNLAALPRFPASQPYDQIANLKYKLTALPFYLNPVGNTAFIIKQPQLKQLSFHVENNDIKPSQLNCYVTKLGKQPITWQSSQQFTLRLKKPLPTGRTRANCTAPSIKQPKRFYWYSQPWFVLNENGSWYPL